MLIKWIKHMLGIKPKSKPRIEIKPVVAKIKMFRINKHYDDMTPNQKKEYARWLQKHDMWDGAMVMENMEKINKSRYGSDI